MPELFKFQQECVDYLRDRKAVLIGDDMGLGKTAEAIALDRIRRIRQPDISDKPLTLVVTYIAIIPAWVKQFQMWNPELKVCAINPKKRDDFLDDLLLEESDVYICHPQAIRLIQADLQEHEWFHIIYDECHFLQNRKAKQTIAAKTISGFYKTGLSGTPAFDKPDDLWSILNWLYPKYWSSYWRFVDEHIVTTEYNGYKTAVGVKNTEKLQKEMKTFYVRRLKEEVLTDLPDKYFTRIEVDLDPKQFRAYEEMRKEMLAWIGENEDTPLATQDVIAQLIRLQQFSAAYATLNEETNKVLLTEPSSKLDAVMEIINSTNEPIVIFSQFSQVIKLLAVRLEKAGIGHGIYTGDTPPEVRAEIIENFQNKKIQVFAGTIQAGGTGITLTAASTVVFIDITWSGATNNQAIDRLHRIGQKNAVHIVHIVARRTLDAKRHGDIEFKWSMVKYLLGEGADPNAEDEMEFEEW